MALSVPSVKFDGEWVAPAWVSGASESRQGGVQSMDQEQEGLGLRGWPGV